MALFNFGRKRTKKRKHLLALAVVAVLQMKQRTLQPSAAPM